MAVVYEFYDQQTGDGHGGYYDAESAVSARFGFDAKEELKNWNNFQKLDFQMEKKYDCLVAFITQNGTILGRVERRDE